MKTLTFILILLVAVNAITAASTTRCGRHGDRCVSDSECCANIKCHRYAGRCQVQITEEELWAAREKILGRKGKDYKK